jgi:hypothetical protein
MVIHPVIGDHRMTIRPMNETSHPDDPPQAERRDLDITEDNP